MTNCCDFNESLPSPKSLHMKCVERERRSLCRHNFRPFRFTVSKISRGAHLQKAQRRLCTWLTLSRLHIKRGCMHIRHRRRAGRNAHQSEKARRCSAQRTPTAAACVSHSSREPVSLFYRMCDGCYGCVRLSFLFRSSLSLPICSEFVDWSGVIRWGVRDQV